MFSKRLLSVRGGRANTGKVPDGTQLGVKSSVITTVPEKQGITPLHSGLNFRFRCLEGKDYKDQGKYLTPSILLLSMCRWDQIENQAK